MSARASFRQAEAPAAAAPAPASPAAVPAPRKPTMASPLSSGNTVAAVSTRDSMTRTQITAPVNRLSHRPFTHGPSTALSLHSSRNTVADGSSTPASVCTAGFSHQKLCRHGLLAQA